MFQTRKMSTAPSSTKPLLASKIIMNLFPNQILQVHLQHILLYFLVKLTRAWAILLEGLQDNVIPIKPGINTYRIKIRQDKGHTMQKTVQRREFPTTAAYTFTDYHSQLEGQNLACVIIYHQLVLSLFNLYVVLSSSSGRASSMLLRDFDDWIPQSSTGWRGQKIRKLRHWDKLKPERMVEIDAIRAVSR